MPASMMIACVALRPKVTGSKIEMPASGPMPGNTPTSVPTRQPRNAYQALAGASATENPRYRLCRVVSTMNLESQWAGLERRFEQVDEQHVGDYDHADAVDRRRQQPAPLDDGK